MTMKRSLTLARRPRIMVRNVVVGDLDQVLMKGTPASGTLQCYNSGGSAASVIGMEVALSILDKLPMASFHDAAERNNREAVRLPAGVYATMSFPVNVADSYSLYKDVRQRKAGVYVIGSVSYRDEIGIQRETRFCRKYDWDAERFLTVNDSDYENSD
jgi:hypothetical protein